MTGIPRTEPSGPDTLLWIKAVPGASRDAIAGVIGDRLKVRVAAPPEVGKANEAICRLVAKSLGVKAKDVTVETGATNPEKVLRVSGMDAPALSNALL